MKRFDLIPSEAILEKWPRILSCIDIINSLDIWFNLNFNYFFYSKLKMPHLMRPPGGEKAKHRTSGNSDFSSRARNAAAPAPRLCPQITSPAPWQVTKGTLYYTEPHNTTITECL